MRGRRWLIVVEQTEGYSKFKALAVATDISPPGRWIRTSPSTDRPDPASLVLC